MVYLGAGVSLAQPTGLPTGPALATAIHARLKVAFHVLDAVNPTDLVAVADAVASLPGGEEALRQTAAQSADFKTAKPAYAHRTIAHLMLEGAIDVLTTNWDNCIERGAGDEQLPTVTDERDLIRVTPPWVLKVHGCASQPDSLLLTSDHLKNPPRWVKDETHARLGSATVIFVGIGDVAGYVKQRIVEAISEVGSVENIRIVAPDIVDKWETSQWSGVAPGLRDEYRIPATADLFMEQLAAAYVIVQLGGHSLGLASDEVIAADFEAGKASLLEADALMVLEWARRVDIQPRPGHSVLKTSEIATVLIALGHLVGTSARLKHNQVFETDEGPIEVLVSTRTVPARRLTQEAENRLQDHASREEPQ